MKTILDYIAENKRHCIWLPGGLIIEDSGVVIEYSIYRCSEELICKVKLNGKVVKIIRNVETIERIEDKLKPRNILDYIIKHYIMNL